MASSPDAHIKVVVESADDVPHRFKGMGKQDPFVSFFASGKCFKTKHINSTTHPKWNQSFDCAIADPYNASLFFTLWDYDTLSKNDYLGGCALSLTGISQGEEKSFKLPIFCPSGKSAGTLNVRITSADYTGLSSVVNSLKGEVNRLSGEVDRLSSEVNRFEKQNDRLEGEVDRFSQENKKLEQVREDLQNEVGELKGEVSKLGELNESLNKTKDALDVEVASLGNKVSMLNGEIHNLTKVREMLDSQVQQQAEQNNQMKQELENLEGIKQGMADLAKEQGESYRGFVDSLTESLEKHSSLISEFAEQNQKLKENRRQLQIDSCLSMVHTFSSWDQRSGLSIEEFRGYLEMLGTNVEQDIKKVYEVGSLEEVFAKLDVDGSGSLNVPEVRSMIQEIVDREIKRN